MVKGYVNWLEEEIICEDEFETKVSALAAEKAGDDDLLAMFLADECGIVSAFRMSEAEKETVLGEFSEWCYDEARRELAEDWKEFHI